MTGGVVPSQPWAPQCSTCSSGRKSGKKRCRVALLGKVAVQCSCHGWWLPSLLLHETPTAEVRLKVAQSPERQLALFHDGTGYAPPCHPQPHKDPECTRRHRKRRSTRVALARARGRPCKCPAVRPSPGHVAQHQGRSEDSSKGSSPAAGGQEARLRVSIRRARRCACRGRCQCARAWSRRFVDDSSIGKTPHKPHAKRAGRWWGQ